jgi:hypothetical protein
MKSAALAVEAIGFVRIESAEQEIKGAAFDVAIAAANDVVALADEALSERRDREKDEAAPAALPLAPPPCALPFTPVSASASTPASAASPFAATPGLDSAPSFARGSVSFSVHDWESPALRAHESAIGAIVPFAAEVGFSPSSVSSGPMSVDAELAANDSSDARGAASNDTVSMARAIDSMEITTSNDAGDRKSLTATNAVDGPVLDAILDRDGTVKAKSGHDSAHASGAASDTNAGAKSATTATAGGSDERSKSAAAAAMTAKGAGTHAANVTIPRRDSSGASRFAHAHGSAARVRNTQNWTAGAITHPTDRVAPQTASATSATHTAAARSSATAGSTPATFAANASLQGGMARSSGRAISAGSLRADVASLAGARGPHASPSADRSPSRDAIDRTDIASLPLAIEPVDVSGIGSPELGAPAFFDVASATHTVNVSSVVNVPTLVRDVDVSERLVRAAETTMHKRVLADGKSHGSLTLPELGRVEVEARAKEHDQPIFVHVRAEESRTTELLANHATELRLHVREAAPDAHVAVDGHSSSTTTERGGHPEQRERSESDDDAQRAELPLRASARFVL